MINSTMVNNKIAVTKVTFTLIDNNKYLIANFKSYIFSSARVYKIINVLRGSQ
jgi:hypothetical protein